MTTQDPIKHVVLLMMENHSFDQMLGALQSQYSDLDGIDMSAPARATFDLAGSPVPQAPTDVQQVERDPNHETPAVLEQIANGNAGFVTAFERRVPNTTPEDRLLVMSYYPIGLLPALHGLGTNFTVCDRWFSSLPGPTWPNRFFALSGTSSGRVKMPLGLSDPAIATILAQTQDTIFDRLNERGRSWKIYYYDFPSSLLFAKQRSPTNLAHYARIKDFFSDVNDASTFPEFVFIEPKYFGADQNDDHPPHNTFKAEKLIADVYNAIRSVDELWESTLLVVVYDEHGGFYDHVSPPGGIPQATPPDNKRDEYTFDRLGVRVPALLISPWVGARVEHTLFDHTSLLRYLTDKWDLGPLGARTAAANSIGVALTESALRSDTVPFIRVPYTDLMPTDPDLEERDVSPHHHALHVLAAVIATESDSATGVVIEGLARGAGAWVALKEGVGRLLHAVGRWLERDAQRHRRARVQATVDVARNLLDRTR